MKNKLMNRIIFYTILILCISAFSYFPKSYSKYIKEEEPAKFYVELEKLYIGYLDKLAPLSTSTYKQANYVVRFSRSQVMKDSDESQYIYINIQKPSTNTTNSKCSITNIITKGKATINGNEATIKYSSKGTDTVSVSYSCNVEDIKTTENNLEVLYTNVYVSEKFMPENIKYLYAKAEGNKMLLTDYYSLYPPIKADISDDGKTLTIPSELDDKYTEFITWLNSLDSNYANDIKSYVATVYNNEKDILDLTKNLKGLTVTYDSENKKYIYQIDNNFIGYARTYSNYAVFSSFTKVVFSNSNLTDSEANEILKYYFTKYNEYNKYSDTDIEKIITYVSSYGSINYMLKENQDGTKNKIAGFKHLSSSDEIGITTSLMSYVNAYLEPEITIEFAMDVEMFGVFLDALTITYDFITPELIDALNQDMNVAMSIVKNNTDIPDKTVYNEYFVVQDSKTSKYILINVSSDGIATTVVKVVELTEAKLLTVTQQDNNLNISITVNNQDTTLAKTTVTNMVAALDYHFMTSYKDEIVDELFTTSQTKGNITSLIEGENIIITYTILK